MKTKIVIYVLDLSLNGNFYNKIKLNISGITEDFSKNVIEISINNTPPFIDDKYVEEVILFNDKSTEQSGIFYFPVYINETNKLFCQINVKGDYLFEIINYNNYYNRLPTKFEFIKEDNTKIDLKEFDKFGLKNIQRITLLNVKKNQINSKVSKIHLAQNNNSGSYLISRITIDKKETIRLHRTRREKYNDLIDLDISQYENYINNIYKYLEGISINQNIKTCIIQEFDQNKPSNDYINKIRNIRKYVRFNQKSDNLLTELHYKSCLIYILYRLNKLSNLDYLYILLKNKEIKDEKDLGWSCKINILFSFSKITKIPPDGHSVDPDLIIFKKCMEGCAYSNAFKLLKDIIHNITADSKLFGYFYLCNSGNGCNRFFKNVISFKLSMVSEKIVKNHLEKIIPEAIFRYSYLKSNGYGFVLNKDGFMGINDGKIFSQDSDDILRKQLLESQDIDCKFTIPILMSFFHELYAHGKNMLNNRNPSSPTHINSITKFKFNEPINKNVLEEVPLQKYYINTSGESGRTLEFFISEDIKIIYALKFSCISLKELDSYKIWIGKDFSNLIKIVKKKTENYKYDFKKHSLAYFPTPIFEGELEEVDGQEEYIYWSDNDYDQEDYKLDKVEFKTKKKNKNWRF